MTDAITVPRGRTKALADIDRCLHHVLRKAASEAARHERVDCGVSPAGDGAYLVRFTSTLPPVEVRFALTPPEGDGPVDVAVEEMGTGVRFPVAFVGADGEGRERALARMAGAGHWFALHLRHRIAEAVDASTLSTPGLDRFEAAARSIRTTPAMRAALGLAAVAGAFLLGGLAAD